MLRNLLFLLLLPNVLLAQAEPFKVTFTEIYRGSIDPNTNKPLSLILDSSDPVNVQFIADKLTMISKIDTIVMVLSFIDEMPMDDYVQYRYMSGDYQIILRYNRYYVSGIIDIALLAGNKVGYLKKINLNKNTTAHE